MTARSPLNSINGKCRKITLRSQFSSQCTSPGADFL